MVKNKPFKVFAIIRILNMPKHKKPDLQKLKQQAVKLHQESINSDDFIIGGTLNDIDRSVFEIGDKKLYLNEYDPPEDDVCLLICGDEIKKIRKDDAQDIMMRKFYEEITMLSLEVKSNVSHPSVYLPGYIRDHANQHGFLNLGETVVKNHLAENGFVEYGNVAKAKVERKLKFTVDGDRIKFTEQFELENFVKLDPKKKKKYEATGQNATITLESYISVNKDNKIEHVFGDLQVKKHNAFAHKLFPPKDMNETFEKIGKIVSEFISSCRNYFNKRKESSFAKIHDKLEEAAFSTKQDPEKLKQELLAIESDSKWHKLNLAKHEIENTYARMKVNNSSGIKDDLNAGGQLIKSSLANMEKFDDEYMQKMAKKIEDLEVKIGFTDAGTLQDEMMDSIEDLKERIQQIKFFKRTAPDISKFMINLGNTKVSKPYKRLKVLKDEIENNRSNEEVVRKNIAEFKDLYESVNKRFDREITDNDIDGDLFTLNQEEFLHTIKEELNPLVPTGGQELQANKEWCPDSERLEQEEEEVKNFLSEVGSLIDDLNIDNKYGLNN